jgi:hypothetical protein
LQQYQCHTNQNGSATSLHLASKHRTFSSRCSLVLPLSAVSQLMVPMFAAYGRCYRIEKQLELLESSVHLCVCLIWERNCMKTIFWLYTQISWWCK